MSSGWQTTPDIAYGPSGLYITFEKMGWNGSSWTNQIWVTKSTDWGANWNTPIQVTSSSLYNYHPRIAVASNGTVMVAYTSRLWRWGFRYSIVIIALMEAQPGILQVFHGPMVLRRKLSWQSALITAASMLPIGRQRILATSGIRGPTQLILVSDGQIRRLLSTSWVHASHAYARPAVCPNPTLPVEQEACVAWTDLRNNPNYDVYFDHVSVCGDGWLSSEEQCDDGNTLNGDCCSATCTFEPAGSPCPDGLFCDGYETCDGSGGCQLSAGNPCLAFPGTVCNETTDTCDPSQVCGNGALEGSEQCDDGNTVNADCCSATCIFEAFGSPCGNQDTTACTDPDSCTGDGYCSPRNQPAGTQCITDGNMCTDDECDGLGICIHINNTDPCDDYLFCTGADTCNGGTCSVHSGDPCFPLLCDEITNTCRRV